MKTKDNTVRRLQKSFRTIKKKIVESIKKLIKYILIDDDGFLANKEEIKYWKNRIFYITEFAILIFGAPLMLYGAYMFYKMSSSVNAIIEIALYIVCAVVMTDKSTSITYKKLIITYGIYLVSIFLLITTGLMGGGMVCVVFAMVLAGCLLEKKQIIQFVSINLLVFMVLTVLLFTGFFDGGYMETYKEVWFINGITAQVGGIILLVIMNSIYNGLEKQTHHIKSSEASLAASEIKHKTMIGNISDAIVILDQNGMVTYNSPNLKQRFPWMSDNIMYGSFYDRFHPEDRAYLEGVIQYLLTKNGEQKTIEARYLTKEKEVGYLELTAVNLTKDPNINGVLINYSDITKRKLWEQEIIFLNQHDGLTGLYNRNYFEIKKVLLDTPEQLPLSVITGDINGLKIINDSLGHTEGDKLLVSIAKIIKKCCRRGDIVARISGDEFNILMPRTSHEEAIAVMQKINSECEDYNRKVIGDLYHLSISLGSGTKVSENESLEIIMKIAEDFMYKRKLLEGRSFHSSIISSMKTALFEKSYETEHHARRMIELSKEVGKAIGLTNQQFDDLELFSTLHDIGKIGIDDQILNKPAALSEEEWVKMRKHSEIGYRIAMASPELMSIAYYILTHHERWDGNGYPQGLKGENIPLLSRILALADAYDAMTNDRPYRKGIHKHAAIAEIEKNSGTQFDPELTGIFINIIKEKDLV